MADETLSVESGELASEMSRWSVERLVCVIGFTTACMAVAVAMYKPPSGIFDDHKLAYYVAIISAGVVGFGEACAAALWMSGSGGGHHHRPHSSLARRCLLCVSLLPLAFVAGLGGVRVLVK